MIEKYEVRESKSLLGLRLRSEGRRLREGFARLSANKPGMAGLCGIGFICLLAALHPVLMHTVWDPQAYDPLTPGRPNPPPNPAPPSAAHLLGTDPYGSDVLSQLMHGAGSALLLGTVAAAVTVVLATGAGAAAAYFGGALDAVLMRIADLILMTPLVVILIFLSAFFKLTLLQLAVGIGLFAGLGGTVLVIKAQALSIQTRTYIEAARALGAGGGHILRRHIIPHLAPISFLYMMFTVTEAVFVEAVLSYFGLIDVKITWGMMIHTAASSGYLLRPEIWWLAFPAGACITLLCSSFYLVGRALEDVVHPRLRAR
ncbi:MAG: ABC transporter permease [Anaerolineales bacterium]|nr:ABC transporter permease [Anaerolineales bacterium]